jgi:hypothetical protein
MKNQPSSPRVDARIESLSQFVVPIQRTPLAMVAIGAGCFVIAGVLAAFLGPHAGVRWASAAVASVSAVAVVYSVRRLGQATPAMVIGRDGICDNATMFGVGFIAWDEIDDFKEYRFRGQVYLAIVPKDLDQLVSKQGFWTRLGVRANIMIGAEPISIPQILLPVAVADLVTVARQWLQLHRDKLL